MWIDLELFAAIAERSQQVYFPREDFLESLVHLRVLVVHLGAAQGLARVQDAKRPVLLVDRKRLAHAFLELGQVHVFHKVVCHFASVSLTACHGVHALQKQLVSQRAFVLILEDGDQLLVQADLFTQSDVIIINQ